MSQTYELVEVDYLKTLPNYQIKIVSITEHYDLPKEYHPFTLCKTTDEIIKIIDEFKPDIIHAHYIFMIETIMKLNKKIPFTIRTHSYDIQSIFYDKLKQYSKWCNQSLCLGILCFPYQVKILEKNNFKKEKLIPCFPVINYDKFYNPNPRIRTNRILNLGACLPKKNYQYYVDIAKQLSEYQLDYLPIGYETENLKCYNLSQGSLINVLSTKQYHEMPEIYRNYDWLLYTGMITYDEKVKNIGFPLSIAEAQASGIGVILPDIRPEMKDYLGNDNVYNNIEDIKKILEKENYLEMINQGYLQAKKSDIKTHFHLLENLWKKII